MMISDFLSLFLVHVLVRNHVIEKSLSKIYQYCFNYIFELIFFFLVMQTISILLHIPVLALIFFATVMPFRSVCGGFHASTRLRCSLLSYSCYIMAYTVYILTRTLPDLYWIIFFFIIIGILYVFPSVVHSGRHFSHIQKQRQHKLRHIFCIVWSVLFVIAYLLHQNLYFHLITICVTIVLVSLLAAVFTTRKIGGYSIDF